LLKKKDIEHIHAHWGSTTATMAWIVSELTGIPWSFTLHRWDILENNILKGKVKSAKFVRCISEHGKNELLEIVGERCVGKIEMLHMGVRIPVSGSKFQKHRKIFTIITPANLLEVKGHQYLIEACAILVKSGIKNFQCIFYGGGPLRDKLERLVEEKKLTNYIKIPGAIPHEKLMGMYKNHEVDLVILPSITTNKGEHEGIPVSLMEAMAFGIPVISTNTGGIPELVNDESGIIVEEKNVKDITDALEKFIKDKKFGNKIGKKGMLKVKKDFNVETNVKSLIKLFSREKETI
jgi:glycosyltransferase involved in cell wall biosynthesis